MKKINFKKIFNVKNTIFLLFIFGAIFLSGHFAFAGIGEALANIVGSVIALFIRAISSILILLVNVLMSVMSYSDFIKAPAVAKGWIVVRDLCNMFFVVVLLIIAFATILGQEEYGAKKFLPKLILAAVLINFSKMICGLMIDVSSVVMLTFVNAFAAIGAGNILDMLGISEVTQIAVSKDAAAVTFSMIVSSYIFGLIYVVIATVVIAAMLGMLVVRLVMIWILVVLSPLAFFLQAVPGAGKYAGQWWSRWTSNLLVGPIIAFFLWLSFAALQGGSNVLNTTESDDLATNNSDMETVAGVGSQAGTTSSMAKFVIAIGMLIGGMQIAQSVGGEAGGAMGKIFGKGSKLATAAGIGALTAGSKAIGRGALLAGGKGINLIPTNKDGKITNKGGNALGNFALGWQADLSASNKKAKKAAAAKYLGKLGIGEKGSDAGQTLIDSKGFQYASNMAKGAAIGAFTGGLGLAATGVAVAGGATLARQQLKKKVKDYEGAETKLTNARGEYSSSRKKRDDLLEIRDNIKTVEDFENNKSRFEELKAKGAGQAGFANDVSTDEKLEYNRLKNIINDKNAISSYSKSKKFINDKNITDNLDEVNQKIQTAEQDVLAKEGSANFEETRFNSLDGKSYEKNKKLLKNTEFIEAFKNTKAAMKDNTKKKQAAQEWIKIAAADPDLLRNMKPSDIYSSAGLSETWKKRFEELNGSDTNSAKAVNNILSEVNDINTPLEENKIEAMAKALAAFKKGGGKIDSATLGRVESALESKGYSLASYNGKVSTQYRKFGSFIEDVKDGSGALQYDAFSKNYANHNPEKDIMGVSFGKLNEKLGNDYKMDAAAGVNQKVDGEKLSKLSIAISSLIDDEISALEKNGVSTNSQQINQLNIAKARLQSGDLSGLSLKNTDVVYKGETDSERRRNEYNTTQHETMHQYGANNEEAVDSAANALQEAKLIGRIPQSGGKSYVEVLGKMIADLEQKGSNSEAINQAVASQINKWSPSNAQRVMENENGTRENIKDVVVNTKSNVDGNAMATEAINKLTDSLEKTNKLSGDKNQENEGIKLSIPATNFFRTMFDRVRNTIKKDDMIITDKLKPLSAMAINTEKAKNI